MRLFGPHEKAGTRPLQYDELVSYTASLYKRGSLLIWLDKEIAWLALYDGCPSRPALVSDAAIPFFLTIKVLFRLPLWQTIGMVAGLLKMPDPDLAVPDYNTLCRRQTTLAVQSVSARRWPFEPHDHRTWIKFFGDGKLQAPHALRSGPKPMAQGPSGYGYGHI